MKKLRFKAGAIVLAILALVGGYALADAKDIVPGLITDTPPKAEPLPFPEPRDPTIARSCLSRREHRFDRSDTLIQRYPSPGGLSERRLQDGERNQPRPHRR